MSSDIIIPEPNDRAPQQLPNLEALAESQGLGLPSTRSEARAIIIDEFGLSKLALNQYLKGINLIKSKLGDKNNQTSYDGKTGQVPAQDQPVATSVLGTPIWDHLIIQGGSYVDVATGKTITYSDQRFDSVLMIASQSHRLVLTDIQGRDDEVIEYVGKASIRVNFKCGVFGNNNNRPRNEILNVVNMLNSNQPLKIKFCNFLSDLNVSEVYVLDKNIPQNMGGYNYQLFEFNAINNVPVILASVKTNAVTV